MDFLKERFSSLFENSNPLFHGLNEEKKEELSLLMNEYPNIFMCSLLEFIDTCQDLNKSETTVTYFRLITSISDKPDIIHFEKSFLIKLFDVLLNAKLGNVIWGLDDALQRLIRENYNLHPLIFEVLEERFPNTDLVLRGRILNLLKVLLEHCDRAMVLSFNQKCADLLTLNLSTLFEHYEKIKIPPFGRTYNDTVELYPLPNYHDIASLVECLIISIEKGAFTPFQDKYHIWDHYFRILLEKSTCDTIDYSDYGPKGEVLGYCWLVKAIFTLQRSFLYIDDPFKTEFLQKYARKMIECSHKFFSSNPPMFVAVNVFQFIYFTLKYPELYHQPLERLEANLETRCPSTNPVGDSEKSPTFDCNLVGELKYSLCFNWMRINRSSRNFWNDLPISDASGSDDSDDKYGERPKRIREKLLSLVEKTNFSFENIVISSRNLRKLQCKCLNLAVKNQIITMDELLPFLRNKVETEVAFYLLGKLSYNPKFIPSYFDINQLANFTLPSASRDTRINATCCLCELYLNWPQVLDCNQQLLDVIFSNIFDKDLILSYCSARLLERVKSSAPDLVLSFTLKEFKKIILRFFTIVEKTSLILPLKFIIDSFDVKQIPTMKEEILLFTEKLCNLGESLKTEELHDAQYPEFLLIANILLEKFCENLSTLDPFFESFFDHYLFINQSKLVKRLNPKGELLTQIFKFDNFIDKILGYILSENEMYLPAADFLDLHLSKNFQQIGNEKINSIRNTINNCDDLAIKDRFSYLLSK
jgi:hypothetical protein